MHGGVKGFECKLLKGEIINKQVFLGFVTHTQKKTNRTKKFLHVYFHKGHITLEEYFIPRSQWISFFAYLTNLLPTYKKTILYILSQHCPPCLHYSKAENPADLIPSLFLFSMKELYLPLSISHWKGAGARFQLPLQLLKLLACVTT